MKNARIYYFSTCFVTLIIGILSRKFTQTPLFIGDVLYAVVAYFGFRFLIPKQQTLTGFIIALTYCFAIEFFQLYQASWIVLIRKTVLGHYFLGQGFLWSDLLCYFLGVSVAFFIDDILFRFK